MNQQTRAGRSTLILAVLALAAVPAGLWAAPSAAQPATPKLPNIVVILADDLGYGDISCYNTEAKVPTVHLDKLAAEGIRFTDAHTPATICTPTRYSLLTGQMPFRAGVRTVFTGVGGPCLITKDRLTLPQMLRDKGYATWCTGKWHVGVTFQDRQGQPIKGNGLDAVKQVDFSRPMIDGPLQHGFDHFFGTACCPTTDWLYAYIVDDRVPVPPTTLLDRSKLPQHPYSKDNRGGIVAPDYDLQTVDLVFLEHSQKFLEEHVRSHPDQPFFLYHALAAVHLASFAAPQFLGKSKAGPHGDYIYEMDYIVGELLKTLERLGVADNTLVMFSSDNGPEVPTVIAMRRDWHHDGARPWRGVKRDAWEGGHRVPFLARWPGKIQAGRVSAQTTNLTDVMATVASAVGVSLPDDAAEDSYDMLPVLLGQQPENVPVRPYTLTQSLSAHLQIRHGLWKYLDHKGSGGNDYDRDPGLRPYRLPELEPEAPGQLYDLQKDPGETTNRYEQHLDIVKEMKAQLDAYRQSGRSAPRGRTPLGK